MKLLIRTPDSDLIGPFSRATLYTMFYCSAVMVIIKKDEICETACIKKMKNA
jgi:hypothetical protein